MALYFTKLDNNWSTDSNVILGMIGTVVMEPPIPGVWMFY
jgi:hypothetical protein